MNNSSVQVIPYLFFEGNCEEALHFYQQVIGGKITIVNRYDAPAMKAPAHMHNKILHARLEFDGGAVYMSDSFSGAGAAKNSGSVSISLAFADLEQAKRVYTALAEGGKPGFPFEKQFWGGWHGNLQDKYGFSWNINFGA